MFKIFFKKLLTLILYMLYYTCKKKEGNNMKQAKVALMLAAAIGETMADCTPFALGEYHNTNHYKKDKKVYNNIDNNVQYYYDEKGNMKVRRRRKNGEWR